MLWLYWDTRVFERRLGDIALACPLRRTVVAFEVYEATEYRRCWCVRLNRGEVVRRELRDSRGPRASLGSLLPRRKTPPMLPIDGPAPTCVRRWHDLAELVEATNPAADEEARAMGIEDERLRRERHGSQLRIDALVDRILLADFAAQRARSEGTGRTLSAVMMVAAILLLPYGLGGLAGGHAWGWWLVVPAAILVFASLHRAFLGGRSVARRVVRGVLAGSLAQLSPSETELREALSIATKRRSDAARYLKDIDVRGILGIGYAMAA